MDERQTNNCEICGEVFTDELRLDEACPCSTRKDAAFHIRCDGGEFVWNPDLNAEEGEIHDFYVIRNGEMRIKATDGKGNDYVLRYTDDLETFGITTDEQLYEASMDEENFYWDMNPWYEVVSDTDEAYSDVFDDLDKAIAEAVRLRKEGH
jgi:hypothetical protein